MLSFTIIIPTYNRPQQIKLCLDALTYIEYPADSWNVIVVDDGSPKPLDEIIDPFKHRLNLTLLRKPNAGPASARNLGAQHAVGEFLAFTDDDCRPHAHWLRELSVILEKHPAAMIGGYTINALIDNPYSGASQLIADIVYRHYNPNPQDSIFFTSNNMVMSKETFLEIGGFSTLFDKAAAEDRDFCDRWRFSGRKLVYAPNAIMYHAHHMTLNAYLRQHFNYGRGAYHFHQVRAERGSGSLTTETKFHLNLANWLIDPITLSRGLSGKFMTFSLLMMWQAANAAGYFVEMGRTRFASKR